MKINLIQPFYQLWPESTKAIRAPTSRFHTQMGRMHERASRCVSRKPMSPFDIALSNLENRPFQLQVRKTCGTCIPSYLLNILRGERDYTGNIFIDTWHQGPKIPNDAPEFIQSLSTLLQAYSSRALGDIMPMRRNGGALSSLKGWTNIRRRVSSAILYETDGNLN
jgi:hypothetical protein